MGGSSLGGLPRFGAVKDRRTVVGCPIHDFCTCVFISTNEPGDRKPLALPHEFEPWVASIGEVIVEVQHHDSPPAPDGLLVGEVIIAPKDIANRMKMAERSLIRHAMALNDAQVKLAETDGGSLLRDAGLERQVDLAKAAALIGDLALTEQIEALMERCERLEAFVTRRKGWKRAWDKAYPEPDDE